MDDAANAELRARLAEAERERDAWRVEAEQQSGREGQARSVARGLVAEVQGRGGYARD